MVSFGEKAKIKKAGNLNYGRSYVTTTVILLLNRGLLTKLALADQLTNPIC